MDALARRLGLGDAVAIGLGSMIGAGIFAAFAPAAAAAGAGLLIGLALAGLVAYCNATSTAQLAVQYPTSGGTYLYGRERLGAWPGFLAGWGFVIGKSASCAAMAMTFAAYAVPDTWQRPVAIAAIVALTAINYRGITRTAAATRLILAVVLVVLLLVAAAGLTSGAPAWSGNVSAVGSPDFYGVLQSAGLLFFAFAGYARVATLAEEVRRPERTIPRAMVVAVLLAVVLYALVAVSALAVLPSADLARSTAPLSDLVILRGWAWAEPLVRIGAAAAALGALLALIAGVGRTILAMARHADLPAGLSAVHPRHRVPHHAEIALAVVVCAVVAVADLRGAIGFSSFGVLLYYLIAHVCAFTQQPPWRRHPRPVQVGGAVGCLVLMGTLPVASVATGVGVLLIGVAYRWLRLARRRT